MKYRYFYQTSENENRDGWISARNRAEAYAALRKGGVRPYRLVGDDPVPWQPWAVASLFAALVFALVWALVFRDAPGLPDGGAESRRISPGRRGQLCGDATVIAAGDAENWASVFPLALDRLLSAYAQPGRPDVAPSALSGAEIDALAGELALPPPEAAPADSPEIGQIKGIVAAMRREMGDYLASGGDVRGYLAFLDSRRADEIAYRAEAEEVFERTPAALREGVLINLNARLRDRGLAELPGPGAGNSTGGMAE